MDVTNDSDVNSVIEESGKSINRLRDLVDDLRYVTELERKVIISEPALPNDPPVSE